jgi:hypothetical protein
MQRSDAEELFWNPRGLRHKMNRGKKQGRVEANYYKRNHIARLAKVRGSFHFPIGYRG